MTIDVGYAHLELPDGGVVDFVDVPGHDRLVGNMLVGAGEIDAAMLVVAADDGPNAQTLEHLELLDALAIADGVVAITKTDLVSDERAIEVADAVRALLARTSLAGAPRHRRERRDRRRAWTSCATRSRCCGTGLLERPIVARRRARAWRSTASSR